MRRRELLLLLGGAMTVAHPLGAPKGAGPFFSGREPHVPAIQSYPTPKQIYLHVTPPTGNSEEANCILQV